MGKHDKKKKKKTQEAKEKKKEKFELKTEKNAKKRALKQKDDDEEDIEALIEKFKKLDAAKVAVVEEVVPPPSPRVNGVFLLNPLKDNELILFGGEMWNGKETFVYNDLYKYNIDKKEWKQISSPNSPPPRCSHQAVTYKNWMYIFGGEFTSPSQNQFYHYKDFWRLNLENNTWENLKNVKGLPSGRSGHRMVRWKNKIFLFGGFYDTLTEVKYFNDLYVFDLDNMKWQKVEYNYIDQVPKPRSGFMMAVHENSLFIHGGYSKEKVKKYGEAQGLVHTDTWCMNLAAPAYQWEKVKKSGFPPTPPRSGMAYAIDKKRVIAFGGVHDVEIEEADQLKSVFFNEMYAFHMDSKRWFALQLHAKGEKKKKKKKKKNKQAQEGAPQPEDNNEDNEDDDEKGEDKPTEPAEDNEQPNETPKDNNNNDKKETTNEQQAHNPALTAINPTNNPNIIAPSPRINSMMAVVNNMLYLYGGAFETESNREITYSDLHTLNLHKMDTFDCLIPTQEVAWYGEDSDDEDDDDDDEDDSEEDEEEGGSKKDKKKKKKKQQEDDDSDDDEDDEDSDEDSEEDEESNENNNEKAKKQPKQKKPPKKKLIEQLKIELEEIQKDGLPVPNPKEALREFFERTAEFWSTYAYEHLKKDNVIETDPKALRAYGFQHATERFKQARPLLEQFEQVSLED